MWAGFSMCAITMTVKATASFVPHSYSVRLLDLSAQLGVTEIRLQRIREFGRRTFSSGPVKCIDMCVSSDAFLVKYSLEQATRQRLHFPMFLGWLRKGNRCFLSRFIQFS